jgi:hypothetical protein
MGEYLFFEWPKKRYQKKGHPIVLAFGCSVRFSVERRCGTRYAQTVLALVRSKPAVLDNTKGILRSKPRLTPAR